MVDRYDVLRRFGGLRSIPYAGLGSMEAALDNQVDEEAGGVSLADLFAEQRRKSMNPAVYRLREGVESMIDPSVGENLEELRERMGGISRTQGFDGELEEAEGPYTVSEVVQGMEDPLSTGLGFSAMTREDIEKLAAMEEAEGTAGEGATMTDMLEHVRRQPLDRADSFDEFIGRSKPPSEISLNEFIGLSRKKEGEGEGEGGGKDTDTDTDTDRSAAQELIDKLAGGKGDSKQLITDYKQEYMDLMPEYEGKTEYEKGMDLMKFGMAIAAGDDPNALKNITKGFLAMGDTFTKDAKEKREFKKQTELASTQAAINRMAEDRQFSRDLTKLDLELMSKEQIQRLKNLKKRNETAADLIKENEKGKQVGTQELLGATEKYSGLVKGALEAREAKQSLRYIAKQYFGTEDQRGEVLGLKGAFKSAVDQALNAAGIQDGFEAFRSRGKALTEVESKKVAVRLADILLKESGKTISDRDRQLVMELVGGLTDTSAGIFVSEEKLLKQLTNLEEILDAEIAKSEDDLDTLEGIYFDKYMQGTGEYGPTGRYEGARKASEVFRSRGDTRKVYKVKDMYDEEGNLRPIEFFTGAGQ